MAYQEIPPDELNRRLNEGQKIFLLDVRQPEEFSESWIPGSISIPLGELAARLNEIETDMDIVIICRNGIRSAKACEYLTSCGYKRLHNLTGGNLAWQKAFGPK